MRPNSPAKPRWHYIILALLVLGLIVQFISRPSSILIPLMILGLIYYLYKRPPTWLQKFAFRGNDKYLKYQQKAQKKPKKKKYRFRVIDGKKKSI